MKNILITTLVLLAALSTRAASLFSVGETQMVYVAAVFVLDTSGTNVQKIAITNLATFTNLFSATNNLQAQITDALVRALAKTNPAAVIDSAVSGYAGLKLLQRSNDWLNIGFFDHTGAEAFRLRAGLTNGHFDLFDVQNDRTVWRFDGTNGRTTHYTPLALNYLSSGSSVLVANANREATNSPVTTTELGLLSGKTGTLLTTTTPLGSNTVFRSVDDLGADADVTLLHYPGYPSGVWALGRGMNIWADESMVAVGNHSTVSNAPDASVFGNSLDVRDGAFTAVGYASRARGSKSEAFGYNVWATNLNVHIFGAELGSSGSSNAVIAGINETNRITITTGAITATQPVTAPSFAGFGIAPIGSVMPWMKSLTSTPSLPSGWVECNGQVLSDTASVYNGVTMPDLNDNHAAGIGRTFLVGGSTSGTPVQLDFAAASDPGDIELVQYQVVWIIRVK